MTEVVMARPQVLAGKRVTMQPLLASRSVMMQAHGPLHMVSLPDTLPILGPPSPEGSLGGSDNPLSRPEEGTSPQHLVGPTEASLALEAATVFPCTRTLPGCSSEQDYMLGTPRTGSPQGLSG